MDKEEKIHKIRRLAKELNLESGPPATKAEIEEMEKRLGFEFPQEYREFLIVFGSLSDILGKEVAGESAVKTTLSLREWYPGPCKKSREFPEFPKNVVVVEEDGFGNCYCLVCSGEDNGKVIFWQHDVYPGQEYPNYPPDRDSDFWIEAPDFWTWVLEKLQRIKKAKRKES